MLQTQVLKTKISETHMLKNKIIFDRELIEKCQINAPRYTSYPTADRFNFEFNLDTQNTQLCNVFNQTYNNDSVSLYIHIPFCNTLCLFCGCNKIITNNRQNITTYLEYLDREIKLYNKLLSPLSDIDSISKSSNIKSEDSSFEVINSNYYTKSYNQNENK